MKMLTVSTSSTTHEEIAPLNVFPSLHEVFGVGFVNVLPSIGLPIVHEMVAPVWCRRCDISVRPRPMSSPSMGWFLPCHEKECKNCFNHPAVWNLCDHCSACSDCCTCQECKDCDSMEIFDCGYCSTCCPCGQEDEEEPTSSQYYGYVVPGWIERGDALPTDCTFSTVESMRDDLANIDPAQAMADFYVSDFVSAVIQTSFRFGTSLHNGTRNAHLLRSDAQTLQSHVVGMCDAAFREYVFLVVGGEVRYHKNVSQVLPDGRSSAWDMWGSMAETIGRENLLSDAYDLFCDRSMWSEGSSIGGPRWADAAKIGLMRERREIDPRTFVDRVFSMQHNGGSLLNKMSWAVKNRNEWNVSAMLKIGDAHHNSDLYTLWKVCSDDARNLLARLYGGFPNLLPEEIRADLSAILLQWDGSGDAQEIFDND